MRLHHLAGALVVCAACAPKAAPPAPTPQLATYTATDFAFAGPDTLKPGMTTIHLVNQGSQEHHLILGRLDDGKTLPEVMAAMAIAPNADPGWVKLVGVAGGVPQGDSTGSTLNLQAGHYVAICFLPDPTDGKSHVMKGMVKEILVAGDTNTAAAPVADVELKMMDFNYQVPDLTAGTHTFHVVNSGPQYHEAQLVRLNDGVDAKTFLAALSPTAKGPPPGKMLGGAGALSAGKENYWTTTLTPGKYLFLCFIPDTANGTPHVMKGMVKEFTIN